jgi:hypothetical protein
LRGIESALERIEKALTEHLMEALPDELDTLSTHTMLDEVGDVERGATLSSVSPA